MKYTRFFTSQAALVAIRADAVVDSPAEIFLFWWELESMPEYSTTMPTGVVTGKFWRCDRNTYSVPPNWCVRAYGWCADPKMAANLQFEIVLREGPQPAGWNPPDWSYYDGWKKQYLERVA